MNKIDELDRLAKEIANAEISLKSVQNAIEKNDKEINTLVPRKNELEQNIEFHKKAGVVPIAQEYGKAKAELSKVKARLILLSADQKKATQACKDIETVLEKFKRDHANLLKTSENNVLRVLFEGRNGKR